MVGDRIGWLRTSLSAAASLLMVACADRPPMEVTPQFQAPSSQGHFSTSPGQDCRLFIGEVSDNRSDAEAMGDIGGRPVRNRDSAGWVRSGLQSLARDPHMILKATADDSDLTVRTEVLKAYTMSLTTEKATNVVLRVGYSHGATLLDTQIYRGTDTSMNWAGGTEETQSSLNAALAQIVDRMHADIASRCHPV